MDGNDDGWTLGRRKDGRASWADAQHYYLRCSDAAAINYCDTCLYLPPIALKSGVCLASQPESNALQLHDRQITGELC